MILFFLVLIVCWFCVGERVGLLSGLSIGCLYFGASFGVLWCFVLGCLFTDVVYDTLIVCLDCIDVILIIWIHFVLLG